MKKLLLGLGSLAAVVSPIAAVVSCGSDKESTSTKQTAPETKTVAQTTTYNGVEYQLSDLTEVNRNIVIFLDRLSVEFNAIKKEAESSSDAVFQMNAQEIPRNISDIELYKKKILLLGDPVTPDIIDEINYMGESIGNFEGHSFTGQLPGGTPA